MAQEKYNPKTIFTTEDGKKGTFELMEQHNGKSVGTWLNGWYNATYLPPFASKPNRKI